MTPEERRHVAEAWRRGQLQWKLDSNQAGIYDWMRGAQERSRIVVANMSRQIGKSVLALVLVLERAIQHPGSQIKYAAQTAKQVRKILRPHMRMLLADCPEELRPKLHVQDGEYRFPNGSVVTIAGVDRDNVETLRGQHAHFSVVDEAGMMDDLEYVVKDVLLPQTLNTDGQIFIISTPAPQAGHAFKAFCDEAEAKDALIERTIYDNPRISEETIAEYCREAGGADSTTWQREYLVQHVTDSAAAVLPEANKERLRATTLKVSGELDVSYRPSHFDTYVWLDPGWNPDFTGIQWAIWDFPRARCIIEDDFVMRQLDTNTLAAVLRERTDALWGKGHRPHLCVSDLDGRLTADLSKLGWSFIPTAKDNLDQAINTLRLSISGQSIPFWTHPRCTATRRQWENAVWNKTRTKFGRTATDGHFDLVACSIYGRRNLQTWRNPMPFAPQVQRGMGLVIADDPPESSLASGLKRIFGLDSLSHRVKR
jgi:hypothetical protein